MDDVVLVLNSGSSSIKFLVFVDRADQVQLKFRGQIEGLYSSPRFVAKNSARAEIGAHKWGEGERIGHRGGVAYLTEFLSSQREENRLIAVGHRVVHGGDEFSYPTLIDPQVLAKLERLVPLAPTPQPVADSIDQPEKTGIASGGVLRYCFPLRTG